MKFNFMTSKLFLVLLILIPSGNARQDSSQCFSQSPTCNIDDQKFQPFNISYTATTASACQSLCLSQNSLGATAYINRKTLTVYCQLALVKEGSICKLYYNLNILGNQNCNGGQGPIGGNNYGGLPPTNSPPYGQVDNRYGRQSGFNDKTNMRVERHLIRQNYGNQQPVPAPYNPLPTQPSYPAAQPSYQQQPSSYGNQPGQPSSYGSQPVQAGCFDGPGGQCTCYSLNSGCPGYCQGPNGGGAVGPGLTTLSPIATTLTNCFVGPKQQEIVGNTIEHYFGGTPGFADGNLANCQRLCQANTACLSITFYTDGGPGLPSNCDLHDKSCSKEPAACAARTDVQYYEKTC